MNKEDTLIHGQGITYNLTHRQFITVLTRHKERKHKFLKAGHRHGLSPSRLVTLWKHAQVAIVLCISIMSLLSTHYI